MLLNVGIGASSYSSRVIPGVSFEYGFGKFISAGLQTDIYSYYVDRDRGVYTSLPTAVRASYHYGKHFLKIRTLDLYGGLAVGYQDWGRAYYHPGRKPKHFIGGYDGLYVNPFAGVRYYFQPHFAVFSEVGHKVAWFKAGVTFRFF